MNIKQKIGGAIATGALFASIVAPAAFAAPVTISGNGPLSSNHAVVVKASKSTVKQKNVTVANTAVFNKSNTGGNKTSFNTGPGSNSITSGSTTTTTTVTVTGGENVNTAESCCCDGQGVTDISIIGNGALSHNGALVVDLCKNSVKQTNITVANTVVASSSNTGNNSASFNTGGDQTITTGGATTSTTVSVSGATNSN